MYIVIRKRKRTPKYFKLESLSVAKAALRDGRFELVPDGVITDLMEHLPPVVNNVMDQIEFGGLVVLTDGELIEVKKTPLEDYF